MIAETSVILSGETILKHNLWVRLGPSLILVPHIFRTDEGFEDDATAEMVGFQHFAISNDQREIPCRIVQAAACWLDGESQIVLVLEHHFEHHVTPASVKQWNSIAKWGDVVKQSSVGGLGSEGSSGSVSLAKTRGSGGLSSKDAIHSVGASLFR